MSVVVLLIIAACCGALGSALAGYSARGCLTSIVLGLIGALIGTWLSRKLGIGDFIYYKQIPLIWSVVGSALFVAVVTLLTGNRRRRK